MSIRLYFRELRGRFIHFVQDEEGSPLVEFSILAPMFLMVMFGVIEWGNVYFVQNNMLLAARVAARAYAVGSITLTPAAAVAAACGTSTNPTPLTGTIYSYTFTFSYNTGCTGPSLANPQSYGNVTMQISTPAAKVSIINYLGSIAASTKLKAFATMQQEYVCPAAAASTTVGPQSC